MKKNILKLVILFITINVFPNSVFAQDDFEEVEMSPIEELAYEEGTGEIRGFGQSTSASAQLALSAAKAQATADIQQKIEQYVRYGLNQYMDETSVGDKSSLDEKTRNDVVIAAKGVVEGVVVLKSRKLYSKSKRKYMYEVCVKYDKAGILSAMEAQSERILKNREKFEKDMQEAWDELDERNGRKSVSEKRAEREERINAVKQDNLDRENKRAVDLENARGKNAVELEKARNQRPPKKRVVIEED